MSKLTPVPVNLQTDFLTEEKSDTQPEIRREGAIVVFPAFVREEEINKENDVQVGYTFFPISIPYVGQPIDDYTEFAYRSYAAIRAYFYGPVTVQMEQQLKGTFAAHQYAVRLAFPKYAGEVIESVENFNMVKSTFWTIIDEVAASVGKTRADFPVSDTSTELMTYAATLGMSAQQVAELAVSILGITADLARFGRNWTELFYE